MVLEGLNLLRQERFVPFCLTEGCIPSKSCVLNYLRACTVADRRRVRHNLAVYIEHTVTAMIDIKLPERCSRHLAPSPV